MNAATDFAASLAYTRSALNITEHRAANATVLALEGNLIIGDGTTTLRQAIQCLVAGGRKEIVLDLAGINFIDSCGLGQLVSSRTGLRGVGGRLLLRNIPDRVQELLRLTKLTEVFGLY